MQYEGQLCVNIPTYQLGSPLKKVLLLRLQETHTCTGVEKLWSDLTGADCYCSHGKTDSRGVAILIATNSNVTVKNVTHDDEGRYII